MLVSSVLRTRIPSGSVLCSDIRTFDYISLHMCVLVCRIGLSVRNHFGTTVLLPSVNHKARITSPGDGYSALLPLDTCRQPYKWDDM